VDAAVDHKAAAAKGDRLQIAVASDREIFIDAKIVDQLLGVQRPAL
jgi:hypothetical protein